MASLELDEPEPASRVEAPQATNLDLNLEMDETVEEELPSEVLISIPQSPQPDQTAETAASPEVPPSQEAAPAAPHSPEQVETENLPHGEEVHQER